MNAKLHDALGDFDKMLEKLPTEQLSPEVLAELSRLKAQGEYLRSNAFRLGLELRSSIFATALGIIIVLGVNYFCFTAGISAAKLHKGFYTGLTIILLHFFYDLWKIWQRQKAIKVR